MAASLKFDTNTELAARRTGMAFQRTRMPAESKRAVGKSAAGDRDDANIF